MFKLVQRTMGNTFIPGQEERMRMGSGNVGGIPAMSGPVWTQARCARAWVVSPQYRQLGKEVGWRGQTARGEKLKGSETQCHPPHICFSTFLQALSDFDICINGPWIGFPTGTKQLVGHWGQGRLFLHEQSSACVTFLGGEKGSALESLCNYGGCTVWVFGPQTLLMQACLWACL